MSARYDAYLNSPHWQQKRQESLAHYGAKCMVCSSTERLQVHHRHYLHIGREQTKDLLVLCGACHSLIHRQHKIGTAKFHKLNKAIMRGYASIVDGCLVPDPAKRDAWVAADVAERRAKRAIRKAKKAASWARAKEARKNKVHNPLLGTWKTVAP